MKKLNKEDDYTESEMPYNPYKFEIIQEDVEEEEEPKKDIKKPNKESKSRFSKLFNFLIYWSILVQCCLYFLFKVRPDYDLLPEYLTTIEALLYFANIVALILIRSEYKVGFWIFISLRAVHELLWLSYDVNYLPIIEDGFSIIFMCLILCLKKNGISGWKVLFNKS